MRITNSIMQNNTLYNINNNKLMEDNLSTQMATGKKVNKPSDDPVVAIRALRLRTNVTEVTQFYSYNSKDATSWLSTTQGTLDDVTSIIDSLYEQTTKGAKEDLTSSDLKVILEEMASLSDEYYSIGNADYAGRYVFTGYRTDTPLTFQESTVQEYSITEEISLSSLDTVKYVDIKDLNEITAVNYTDAAYARKEQDIEEVTLHRIRLSYKNIDTIVDDPDDTSDDADAAAALAGLSVGGYPATMYSINASGEEGAYAALGEEEVRFIPETGEVLIGQKVYDEIMEAGQGLTMCYKKTQWENGDLNPEHYFSCSTEKNGEAITYNTDADGNCTVKQQLIEYDIGYNQKIQVNTNGYEVFNPGLVRDISDLTGAIDSLSEIEETIAKLEEIQSGLTVGTDGYITVQNQLEAAKKAYTHIRDNVQKMFEGQITKMQGYLDQTNLAITNSGTRSSRLALAQNRLMDQKTNYETLKSENEDSDITEITIKLRSVQLSYEAALMATSKTLQQTLLNYL